MLFHSLEADTNVEKDISLCVVRKSPTGDDFNATGLGLGSSDKKILHSHMLFGIIDSYGKRRRKIIHPRGNVRDQMGTVTHKNLPPGIGKRISSVGLKLHGVRFGSPSGAIWSPLRSIRCLDLGMQKCPHMEV